MNNTDKRLKEFQAEHNAFTKGPLSLLVQLSRAVKNKPFPLDSSDFLTENKGQVSGLGGGTIGLMIKYVEFLNAWTAEETIDFVEVENFWARQVQRYFNNQPFTLMADPSCTIGASLDELFDQARKRQKENTGTQYLGTILQHLIAAKLSLILPPDGFEIHGASVADAPTIRSGDFVINNTILHCTTAPGEPLIQKCKANIRAGCLPVIITIFERVRTARDLAADAELSGRVEVWDVKQFLSTNINEHSLFDGAARNSKLADIIDRYNAIIDEKETDPSLRIEFVAK